MFSLKKVSSNDYKYAYDFYLNDEKIGGFYINNMDYITFFIDDARQGNGYGNILFEKILNELKNLDIQKVYAEVASDNIKARKMFSKNGIPDAGMYQEVFKYVIFLK